ncbi:MAG: serine hydrolase domain-containing protein [Kangiellaceae bacterium]
MSKHSNSLFIGLVLVIAMIGCGGGSSDNASAPLATKKTLPEILDSAVSQGADAIFVYIDQDNNQPIALASGIQNRSNQQSANPNSLFKVASISKLFIAVAATKLVANSTVSLDDNLETWLPEIATRIEGSSDITLRLLLQHRSGVPDFDSQVGFSWENEHSDIDETLEFALDLPADFTPNARYEYSNTNYLLISKILDQALGFDHKDYIKSDILTPLDLSETYLLYSDIEPERLVKGYWNNIERSEQDYNIPGGSMISTVKDIAVFIKALNEGTLLSAIEQDIYNSVYFLNHSGWLPGYQSIARYHSNKNATVIQFINTTGSGSESVATSTYSEIVESL